MTAKSIPDPTRVFSYDFIEGKWRRGAPSDAHRAAIFDSWLVQNGKSIAMDLHLRRFLYAVHRIHSQVAGLDEAAVDSIAKQRLVPNEGQWFPKVEYALEDRQLYFHLRPAPKRQNTASVWTFPGPDPRAHPTLKGADLDKQTALRAFAKHYRADEAVLSRGDPRYVTEGAFAALVWWEGDVLCAPPFGPRILPSITRVIVESIARTKSIDVEHRDREVSFVAKRPAWLLNSLHGIRPIVRWDGQPTPYLQKRHAATAFCRALEEKAHRRGHGPHIAPPPQR